MPDPDRLLRTLYKAADLVRQTPGRTGRTVLLTHADSVMVGGDLHGDVEHFKRLFQAANLSGNTRRHFVIQEVLHGKYRYPLGGDKSHQLLDLFSAMKLQFPERVHLLMGNHELAQWSEKPILKNDENLLNLFRAGVEEAYGEKADEIFQAYMRLLGVLPIAIKTPNRILLTHTVPSMKRFKDLRFDRFTTDTLSPEEIAPTGAAYGVMWGRDVTAGNVESYLQAMDADWLVTGHIVCEAGFAFPNDRQTILDCCGATPACGLYPCTVPLDRESFRACVRPL